MKHFPFNDIDADLRPSTVSASDWARLTSEERLAAIKAGCQPPVSCGPDVVSAPARGAFRVFRPIGLVPGSEARVRDEGYRAAGEEAPRKGVAVVDVFDRMLVETARRKMDAPLSPGQIAIGRRYRALAEQHDAGGFKLSSLNSTGGGAGALDVMDLRLSERRELLDLRTCVGGGVAMSVRRVRPSARGVENRLIRDLDLIDSVCLRDMTLTEVLRAFGWSSRSGNATALRASLCSALDRMQGYR